MISYGKFTVYGDAVVFNDINLILLNCVFGRNYFEITRVIWYGMFTTKMFSPSTDHYH